MFFVCVSREDDDINDVASMAGVNLREENAQILTTMVGSVVQSCQDQLFLSPNPMLSRILHTGTKVTQRPICYTLVIYPFESMHYSFILDRVIAQLQRNSMTNSSLSQTEPNRFKIVTQLLDVKIPLCYIYSLKFQYNIRNIKY